MTRDTDQVAGFVLPRLELSEDRLSYLEEVAGPGVAQRVATIVERVSHMVFDHVTADAVLGHSVEEPMAAWDELCESAEVNLGRGQQMGNHGGDITRVLKVAGILLRPKPDPRDEGAARDAIERLDRRFPNKD